MAVTRLTDIITVFESKWSYGDVKFGYEGEVNQDHDIQYPLMLIQPPESTIPVIYEGRELYSFEINFYNLYSQASQSVVTLQQRWDNLQDLANEWLDLVLKNYQDVTVTAYLNDESIEIERVKEVANDRLVQIKLNFTMSGFTKCFRPTSNFPTDYSSLVGWLSADSNATFNIATKKLSSLGDRSGYAVPATLVQETASKQPLRIGYDGANDKTYLSFNGTSETLTSTNRLQVISDSFTIFEVSQFGAVGEYVFHYEHTSASIIIKMHSSVATRLQTSCTIAGSQTLSNDIVVDDGIIGTPHICAIRRDGAYSGTHDSFKTLFYNKHSQQSAIATDTTSTGSFDDSTFYIGSRNGEANFLSGQFNELIIYDRALTDAEINDVVGYLNLKYKIY
jgi:hypothetical protein|tara:strand:+ start:181 stop:1359 length:1179 start_codon:yes stop_codon:yes gene_type:complete